MQSSGESLSCGCDVTMASGSRRKSLHSLLQYTALGIFGDCYDCRQFDRDLLEQWVEKEQ